MDLALSDDQIAILDAIDSLVRPYAAAALHDPGYALTSSALDDALATGGFLDVAFDPDLGTVTAALIVERLARLPYATEVAASALVRPLLGDSVPGPLALVDARHWRRPIRFLKPEATVLLLDGDAVTTFMAEPEQLWADASLFAYPMSSFTANPAAIVGTSHDGVAQQVATRWRVGLAAEAAGLLAAALDSAVAHVTDRHQFGRPIATFQAVRHRLAEAQVRTNGLYWLAMKAAATLDPADAALAAFHAQESARIIVYDLHQFLGAMGMTLEHSLHLWTYRLKALIGELGGRGAQAVVAADALWG